MLFDRDMLNRLYRYAYTLSGDEPGAGDLLQDTVERCLQRPPGALACPEAYARRVMRNRYIDIARRRKASPETDTVQADAELLAIDTQCLESLTVSRDMLQQAWSRLDAFEREILYYWAVEDMTAAQIASTLGSRRGTVLARIHRLRARLRAEFGDDAATEGVKR
jgi:RNA polymerase sigma-70 factor (ECF subfamily)